MSTPDEIRANIEATRGDLGADVDALADKVSPSAIAHRQTEKVKNRFDSVRESVMGAANSAKSSSSDTAQSAVGKAKGNPLAIGLIAFGAGWLVSSLIPASSKEEELAGDLKDRSAPLVDNLKQAAAPAVSDLKDAATQHASDLKDSAQEAVQTVRGEAQSSASDVKDSAQQARDDVQGA